VTKRDRAVRAVRAAQRELQDEVDEAQLQSGIGGAQLDYHPPATSGRTAARAHPASQSRLPAYYPAAASAAAAPTAAAAAVRRTAATPAAIPAAAASPAAAAAAASGPYVTPRAAKPPDWHEQWCAPDWSGEGTLKAALGSGPQLGEQQQHWSPHVRGS